MKEKIYDKGSAGRAFAGILVAYIIFAIAGFLMLWAYDVGMIGKSDRVINWIVSVLLVLILYLYTYGWLGCWLIEMSDSRNIVIRIFGKIFGFIGFLIRPYPLMAFGPNKKRIFLLFVSLPLAIFGIVLIILGVVGVHILSVPSGWHGGWSGFFIILGVVALLNSLLALATKKCPNCGCIMGKVDYDMISFKKEKYDREYSQKVGYVSDSEGNTVDVYQKYNVEHSGYSNTVAKTFTCNRCGTKKQGKGITVHEMSLDDPRRNL